MYTAYLQATGQTEAISHIRCYFRHKFQTPCMSGLIAFVTPFNQTIFGVSIPLPTGIRAAVCISRPQVPFLILLVTQK
jgi:hypothetical protein